MQRFTLLAVIGAAAGSRAATPPPLRIMPLGDSLTVFDCRLNAYITADDRTIFWPLNSTPPISIYPKGTFFVVSQGGYRGHLAHLLDKSALPWSFVGRQFTCGSHEGYAGETIEWLANNVIADAMNYSQPDVVLFLGGTNDFFWPPPRGSRDPDEVIQRLRVALNKIFAASPTTSVLLLEVPKIFEERCKYYHTARWHPGDCPKDMQQNIAAYNTRLPAIADEYRALGNDLHLVQQPAYNESDYWVWGIHFNVSGFEKMAAAWHGGIMRVAQARSTSRGRL